MWAHYANGHRGFCLEFDTSYKPFLETQKIHLVNYDNSYPHFSPMIIIESGYIPIDPLITKSKHWIYENEWRIIIDVGNSFIEYDPKSLTAIYFGCLMPSPQIHQICSVLDQSITSLYKMRRSEDKFEIIPAHFHCS